MARTDTEDGIEKTLAIAPERETETPLDGAGAESMTVHEVLALGARVGAAHFSDETTVSAVRLIVNCAEEPFREAVTVAL